MIARRATSTSKTSRMPASCSQACSQLCAAPVGWSSCSMVYDSSRSFFADGEWHCPYTPEWLQRVKEIVKHCNRLTNEQVSAILQRRVFIRIKPGEYLNEEQDRRGLTLSYCKAEEERYSKHPTCCTATYDYDTIPEVVVTNGEDDWPLRLHRRL